MTDIAAALIDQVRAAAAAKRPLVIRGGGSKTAILGRGIAGEMLEVGGHRGIVAYDPTELVLTARAGTPLAEIEAALAERGQALSFEPPYLGVGATLGGTLACNLSGPARPWGGSMARRGGGAGMAESDSCWADLREQRLAFFAGSQPLWRLSVASSTPPMLHGATTLIDWGGAQRWVRSGDLTTLATVAAKAGGHVILFRGGDRGAEVRQSPPPALGALHRRLKASFDPAGILNPGRLYGWM